MPEPNFVACASRHQGYLREATQCNEVNFQSCTHDLKLLIQRFSFGKTFHEDAGGGGPQSNMNYIPYAMFYATYLLLSSNTTVVEEKRLDEFLADTSLQSWVWSSYRVEGPLYFVVSSVVLKPFSHWQKHRLTYLKRLMVTTNVRHFTSNVPLETIADSHRVCLDFKIYKPYLLTWSLTELLYTYFENIGTEVHDEWPMQLFNFIRNNDCSLLKTSERILSNFNENFLPCTTFEEFLDITGKFNFV